MTKRELLSKICKEFPELNCKKAKVIILTNVSDMNKTEQALENEIFQYLVKTDIKLEDLVLKVKEFMN